LKIFYSINVRQEYFDKEVTELINDNWVLVASGRYNTDFGSFCYAHFIKEE
jgi:hypothetical protein